MDLEAIQKAAEAEWTRVRAQMQQMADGQKHLLPMQLLDNTHVQIGGAFLIGLGLGLVLPRLRAPFTRFATVEDIPNFMFQEQRKIKAKAINFSDGDTLRVRHLPLFRGLGPMDGKLSEQTLQIRLCAIDTPETAKFGNQGQPFGDEAKAHLTKLLENRKLTLTLLQKDQYARAVCLVEYGWGPFKKDASEELLKVGLANVYRQTGAVYGGKQATYDKLEAKAKAKKLKMWSQGDDFETTSAYKARIRAEK
ncbi:hypothetical protein SPRG_04830 [Saprolegnia parasitica CBS 223.65]|uniref:TNase-like domain-containing protein n=1 Tax=Saprolegnia parasitica (strain CBS 223.65) TaxID=695850 RepID=A0A067CVU8_SAPPC|nr:hypothetical protein SPRG_04830 [Saprolegnia parasitica CBS 223.65]KDO30927.1 hypothetical protein SPRG_04830 [Saprolegnia parasitica CBS 223.65]|eukprot:XP_012198618.1 hypothetical protein SPRG_04830 [Saprolegnia parasitica CBS 223.65]